MHMHTSAPSFQRSAESSPTRTLVDPEHLHDEKKVCFTSYEPNLSTALARVESLQDELTRLSAKVESIVPRVVALPPSRPSTPSPRRNYARHIPTTRSSLMEIIKSSPLNILLLFIPVGWALYFAKQSGVVIFVTTFISVIPLAQLIGYGTEELTMRVGPTVGGLLNATLGNTVELIVSIIALSQCKLTIVQSSLMGSILSNLLLVLGMCFFCGGTKFADQAFKQMQSQLHSTLLVLSVIAVLLPGAYHFSVQWRNQADNISSDDVSAAVQASAIMKMSRGVAIILLFIYGCYLFFTLYSHEPFLQLQDDEQSTPYIGGKTKHIQWPRPLHWPRKQQVPNLGSNQEQGQVMSNVSLREEEEEEQPKLTLPVTIGLLVIVSVLVGVTSEFLVDSIDSVVQTGALSEEWVGLILIPIIGNAAEHVSAVTVAVKDKVDLAINIAVGSSIQIAVFVIPFVTVLAWIMGKNLTMLFDPFESLSLFLAVMVVSYTVQDGRSNWLEGMILMCVYVILALCFFFYPGYDPTTYLGITCT
ncbi:calcium/proton exchanger [Dacryopinax primogenitus]|uniref:Calcium/proton exchanger n=1 Tax=Dacryopinax primogenitus (strain DJM 731) TaxID=1858805 RepID=M5FXJ2_DACPD|nr:calcium/proton exchanger [Dacryopinax primogenitus]EJT98206.1 calcium/proton exchanger [Dacryopinax primogenitus]